MNKLNFLICFLLAFVCMHCTQPKPDEGDNGDIVDTQEPYIRYNASLSGGSNLGESMLNDMATGMAKIKDLPCTNPISWYYQGAVHWVPDVVDNGNPFCPEYQNVSDAMEAWRNCTHTNTANSNFQFLIWHRLYIWHFEKIIRELSGNPRFALPFWKYVDPAFRVMPGKLRDVQSSLYTDQRLPGLNVGEEIEPLFSHQFLDSATQAAFETDNYADFNSAIDGAPHGMMHVYIGGGYNNVAMFNTIYQRDGLPGWMTKVPSAGFDPVFWLHHSNIDYLWTDWESGDASKRPKLQDFEQYTWAFVFPEPDGSFKTYTMEEAYNTAFSPDYIYQGLPVTDKTVATDELLVAAPQQAPVTLLSDSTKIEVGAGATVIPLQGSMKSTLMQSQQLLASDTSGAQFSIRITVSFETEPTGGYAVYLSDNDDSSQLGEFLGAMSFFGAALHAHHGGGLSKTFVFDATDELDSGGDTPHLIIQKSGGNNINVTIEEISVIRR